MIACMLLWSSEGLRWKKVFMCGYNWDWDWRNADFAPTTTPLNEGRTTLLCSWSWCRLRQWLDLTHISNILHECYHVIGYRQSHNVYGLGLDNLDTASYHLCCSTGPGGVDAGKLLGRQDMVNPCPGKWMVAPKIMNNVEKIRLKFA